MTDVKDVLSEIKSANEGVQCFNERVKAHDEAIQNLDNGLKEIQGKMGRPMYGNGAPAAGAETKAVGDWLRTNQTKSLSTTDDAQGVTVREDWSSRIAKLIRESSPIRSVAGVMQTNSNELAILVDRDEPDSDWVSEVAERVPTDASFMTRHKIPVIEHYAYPSVTLQMLEDSEFNVEGWLSDKIASRFARQESAAFVNGSGDGEPRGLLDYGVVPNDEFEWSADPSDYKIGAIYTGQAGAFANSHPDDALFDLVDALKADYLPGASFLMTRAMRNKLRKLRDQDDRPLLQMSLAQSVPDTLLGYPVRLAEDMPSPSEDGAVGLLFGDFTRAYTVVDRVGLTLQRDNITRPGYARWYVRKRTGGAMTNPEAVKALVMGTQPE